MYVDKTYDVESPQGSGETWDHRCTGRLSCVLRMSMEHAEPYVHIKEVIISENFYNTDVQQASDVYIRT